MRIRAHLVLVLLCGVLLAACQNTPPQPTTVPTAAGATTTSALTATVAPPTATPVPPTPTPEPPAAARVNGILITQAYFEKELARYEAAQQALGRDPASEGTLYQVQVLDALIEQAMIEQAAIQAGISITEDQVEAEFQRLVEATGGQGKFDEWLGMNQYTLEEFRAVLHSQMTTQAMIEQITADVPDTVEQVHARHIVVDSQEMADFVLAQLQEGTDFATLALEYSLDESTRMNGGDLDFFPRGLLLSQQVEDAVFDMQPGTESQLVESDFGFHIVQVLERDPARPVQPEMQQQLRSKAFEGWLEKLWETATVERNI